MESYGLLVKDDKGNTYHIRPEILEATKVSDEYMKSMQDVKGIVGPSLTVPQTTVYEVTQVKIPVDSTINPEFIKAIETKQYSTVMCPW